MFDAAAAPGRIVCLRINLCTGIFQPMISRHLALLRDSGLVNDRRVGQWIYYCIHPELAEWAKTILDTTSQANSDQVPFSDDLQTLIDMPNRVGASCCA